MTGTEAIRRALTGSQSVLTMFIGDLSDADLLVRPVPNANHIAWQIGHLIAAESQLLAPHLPGVNYPELPAGFVEQHKRETASQDPPTGFLGKAAYLQMLGATRQATIEAVAKLTDADLNKPVSGPMSSFAPTLGELLLLASNHILMHAGQFSVVRRKLGKPIVF